MHISKILGLILQKIYKWTIKKDELSDQGIKEVVLDPGAIMGKTQMAILSPMVEEILIEIMGLWQTRLM